MEIISSLHNPKIKEIVRLSSKSRERKEKQLFICEGAREWHIAQQSGYTAQSIFVCPEIFQTSKYPTLIDNLPSYTTLYYITAEVFNKIAYREHSDGVIVVAKQHIHTLEQLDVSHAPLILVIQGAEKPGNLGAIYRTADAAQVDAILVCDPLTDLYNPNVIRSSLGCVFSVPTAICSSSEAFHWLSQHNIHTFAAELQGAIPHHQANFCQASAIIMGTEANGLTPFWITHAHERIKIPMYGKIDSLNLSVATAVITFEAIRQRGK